MDRDFRFGLSIRYFKSREALVQIAKRAEDLGFDVLCVPDHLGAAAPFPTLTAAAMVTEKIHLSMYVLNAAFYKPALLSRDIGALDLLSDGRLEVGLGTGYVREEFEAAELPYPSAGARVDHLEHMTGYLTEHHPRVPIMIAGSGDRVMTLAARHADIIGLTGAKVRDVDDPLAERVEFVRTAAGDRFSALELNLVITAVPPSGRDHSQLVVDPAQRPGSVRRAVDGAALGAQRIAARNGRPAVGASRKVRSIPLHRAGQPHRQLRQRDRRTSVSGPWPRVRRRPDR